MINYIWGVFIILGITYSIINKDPNLTNNLLTSGKNSIDMILTILPLMCLWLGITKIAEASSLLTLVSKKLSKVVRIIFPEIPKDHPAIGYISSNIVMNMLGLGNAATPFGIKAMEKLKELNQNKDVASRSIKYIFCNHNSHYCNKSKIITWINRCLRNNTSNYSNNIYINIYSPNIR